MYQVSTIMVVDDVYEILFLIITGITWMFTIFRMSRQRIYRRQTRVLRRRTASRPVPVGKMLWKEGILSTGRRMQKWGSVHA